MRTGRAMVWRAVAVLAVILGGIGGGIGAAQAQAVSAGQQHHSYAFRDLGAAQGLNFRTTDMTISVFFQIPRSEVPTAAHLHLGYAWSPALITDLSRLEVSINDERIRTLPLVAGMGAETWVDVPIPPEVLQDANRIGFRFIGHYQRSCEDPLHTSLWATVSPRTTIELTTDRLPLANDLSLLPRPFFDDHDPGPVTVPMVLSAQPSDAMLESAGIVASWFGALGAYRAAHFPVTQGGLPAGNAVAFVLANDPPPGVPIPPISGPTIAEVANPADPASKLLLVMGRDAEELKAAATGLVLSNAVLAGDVVGIAPVALPRRKPYDASRWVSTDHPIKFGQIVRPEGLRTEGFLGSVNVGFRSAPDLFLWRDQGVPLTLRYRPPQGDWIDWRAARVDLALNGAFIKAQPLLAGSWIPGWLQPTASRVGIGTPEDEIDAAVPPVYFGGQNRLEALFDIVPRKVGNCRDVLHTGVGVTVDPASTIDLSNVAHYAVLPEIGYFASAAFPFTRMADLSETGVVLGDQPSPQEISVYLTAMAMAGASTGDAALKVRVVRSREVDQLTDRDLLVIGLYDRHPFLDQLGDTAPVQAQRGQIVLTRPVGQEQPSIMARLADSRSPPPVVPVSAISGNAMAALFQIESPLARRRNLVAIAATTPAALAPVLQALTSSDRLGQLHGGVALFAADSLTVYPPDRTYINGRLPWLAWLRWTLSGHWLEAIAGSLLFLLVVAVPAARTIRRLWVNRKQI